MEKSKIIKYLNATKFNNKNSFVSEIRNASKSEDSSTLYLHVIEQEFISDSTGEGFHNSKFKTIDIQGSELKKVQRDLNIDSLLDESEPFDLESTLYSAEQLEKLNRLRDENKIKLPKIITKSEYYASFKNGDKVYFNNESGVITYCHKPNKEGHLQFTVNAHGKETKLVNPFKQTFQPFSSFYNDEKKLYLSKRKMDNYDCVEVPTHVSKLSTKELLNYLDYCRKSVWRYIPNNIDEMHLRAELSRREHVPNKIEAKKKRIIAKKHGSSKSKNRLSKRLAT